MGDGFGNSASVLRTLRIIRSNRALRFAAALRAQTLHRPALSRIAQRSQPLLQHRAHRASQSRAAEESFSQRTATVCRARSAHKQPNASRIYRSHVRYRGGRLGRRARGRGGGRRRLEPEEDDDDDDDEEEEDDGSDSDEDNKLDAVEEMTGPRKKTPRSRCAVAEAPKKPAAKRAPRPRRPRAQERRVGGVQAERPEEAQVRRVVERRGVR